MNDDNTYMNNDFIDQWYIGLELWYNHTDRYMDAMEIWQLALQNYYNNKYNNNNHIESCGNDTDYSSTTGTSSSGSMDHLELEWKKLIDKQNEITRVIPANTTATTTITHTFPSFSFLQFHIFIAGTCLDAQQYHIARQILYQLMIYHLLPFLFNVVDASSSQPLQLDDYYYQLLNKALQEYIATYDEEVEDEEYKPPNENVTSTSSSLSSWMIGRRIATLRNLISSSTSLSPTPRTISLPTKQFWNTMNIYQRPPYYIHYPTFLLNNVCHSSNKEEEMMMVYSDNNTPVLQRQYHPVWCQQLEHHIDIILDELQQYLYCDDNDGTKSSLQQQQQPNHHHPYCWTSVGALGHRDHNAGIHDGKVVVPGGNWQEIILFSSHHHPASKTTAIFPRTKQLIETYCQHDVLTLMKTGIGEVILSRMGPQSTHILPHTASHNIRYTAHLPLIVPSSSSPPPPQLRQEMNTTSTQSATTTTTDNTASSNCCYIRVGEEICHWEVGKMLVFDDSYEHEVINTTNEIRIVLLLRFWHPLLQTNSDRIRAVECIEQAIHTDQLQRYNPPVPDHHGKNDTDRIRLQHRQMEQSYCPYCQQTGYTSIRFIVAARSFACSCGQDI